MRISLGAIFSLVLMATLSFKDLECIDINKNRVKIELPKIFDWHSYKQAFHKIYPTLRDELARSKLFVANALKVFSHNLGYRIGLTSYYLSVNQFTDFTPPEIRSMYNLKSDKVIRPIEAPSYIKDNEEKLDSISLDELKIELARIIEEKQPGYEIIADQLRARIDGAPERKKRAISNLRKRTNEVLDELRLPDQMARPRESSKYVRKVPSNNKNYKPRELVSQASQFGQGQSSDPLSPEQLNSLNVSPGIGFIRGQLSWLIGDKSKLDASYGASKLVVDEGVQKQIVPTIDIDDDEPGMEEKLFLDLRETGCFTVPKSQGKCGSCYAFAITAILEWWHCMQTGKLVPLSEQYMVDCGNHSGLLGCKGGDFSSSGRFIMDYGVELAHNYPYMAKQGVCPFEKHEWERAGYKKLTLMQYTDSMDRWRWPHILTEVGPLLFGLVPPKDFAFYGGSVHPGLTCNHTEGLHAVVLVGHGIEDDQEYWLLRNSFNYNWGEKGYFKLSKKAIDTCFDDAYEVEVDFLRAPPGPYVILEGDKTRKLSPSEAYNLTHR